MYNPICPAQADWLQLSTATSPRVFRFPSMPRDVPHTLTPATVATGRHEETRQTYWRREGGGGYAFLRELQIGAGR